MVRTVFFAVLPLAVFGCRPFMSDTDSANPNGGAFGGDGLIEGDTGDTSVDTDDPLGERDPESCEVIEYVCSTADGFHTTETGAPAVATYSGHPSWTASIDGAEWIWDEAFETSPTTDETHTIYRTLNLPDEWDYLGAVLEIASDNGYLVTLDGAVVASDSDSVNYTAEGMDTWDLTSVFAGGPQTLGFQVTNEGLPSGSATSNPGGLMYCIELDFWWGATDETCNGIDDDCDGDVDEGLDLDGDGDCAGDDEESCDGTDEDGDGFVDEGLADCDEVCIEGTVHYDLGPAQGFNVFVLEDYDTDADGFDIGGSAAAGGNVHFSSFAVGDDRAGGTVLVAGEDLTLANGTVHGDAYYGGVASIASSVGFDHGGSVITGEPIDFDDAAIQFDLLSQELASLDATGTTTLQSWGGIDLEGTDADLNVFELDGDDLSASLRLTIDVPAGSVALINVDGTSVSMDSHSQVLYGADQTDVLYNLHEASWLDIHSISVQGSVLAPMAEVTFVDGNFEGTLVALEVIGNGEFHDHPFDGTVTVDQECGEVCDGYDNDGDGAVDEDYDDTDGDGTADCVEVEDCDGDDDDGDGLVDEDFEDADGDGFADCLDEACDGSDDDGDGAIDEGFSDSDGDGFADCVDGEECDAVDNDGDGAVDEGYDDTDGDGTRDCVDLEGCDGYDNDGDGRTDEGFSDGDLDGVADCVDTETCDGHDNDGDGTVDEGYADTDGDGTADCVDTESCDGLDNDGDGDVDEGFSDTDGDGTADCLEGEDCDGYDNDGDGGVDEGYDADGNGIADCFETCPLTLDFETDALGNAILAGQDLSEAYAEAGVHISASNLMMAVGLPPTAFDSSSPTGGDDDLGTPNEVHGGPGAGDGGEVTNDSALGNLLIVPEDIVDWDGDGLLDDPDDLDNGGLILFTFDTGMCVNSMDVIDVETDEAPGTVYLYDEWANLTGYVDFGGAGDNSVEALEIDACDVWYVIVELNGSGAIDNVDLCPDGEDEVCDGDDNDGDGDTDEDLVCNGDEDGDEADSIYYADDCADLFAYSLDGAGDMNADGYDDFIIGAPDATNGGGVEGAATIWHGPEASGLHAEVTGNYLLDGEMAYDAAGFSVAGVGDLDNDGCDDVAVGAPYAGGGGTDSGSTYVVLGIASNMDLGSADAELVGGDAYESSGWSVSGAGDVNDDGYADLLIGAPYDSDGGSYAGAAYLVEGPIHGTIGLDSSATAVLLGESSGDVAGVAVEGVGDVDQDGYDDVAVGAPYEDAGGTYAGAVYLMLGSGLSGTIDLGSADVKITGEVAGDNAGVAIGHGDFNGDGYPDLLIGAPGDNTGGTDAGSAFVLYGPTEDDVDLGDADAEIYGEVAGDLLGYVLDGAGDVDGDDNDDFVLGAYENDEASLPYADAGIAYLVLGPVYGTLEADEAAPVRFLGQEYSSLMGFSVAGAGDIDGNGRGDLLIGAPGYHGDHGAYSGRAYLWHGENLE